MLPCMDVHLLSAMHGTSCPNDRPLQHLGTNDTEQYLPEYEWMSTRMHEKYFVKCDIAPIVFNDLRDGALHRAPAATAVLQTNCSSAAALQENSSAVQL